jgi:hypothetical protein
VLNIANVGGYSFNLDSATSPTPELLQLGCGCRMNKKVPEKPEPPKEGTSWLEPHNQWMKMAKERGYHIPAPKQPAKPKPED